MSALSEIEKVETCDGLKRLPNVNHFGIRRTMLLARKVWGPGKVTEDQVEAIMKSYNQCLSIDPAPVQWDK